MSREYGVAKVKCFPYAYTFTFLPIYIYLHTCDWRNRDLILILLGVSLEIKEVPHGNSGPIEATHILTTPKHLSSVLVTKKNRHDRRLDHKSGRSIQHRMCLVVYLPCDESNLPMKPATFSRAGLSAYVNDAWQSVMKMGGEQAEEAVTKPHSIYTPSQPLGIVDVRHPNNLPMHSMIDRWYVFAPQLLQTSYAFDQICVSHHWLGS